jgi:hypothetical protein
MILGKQSRQRDTRVVWIFHLVWICRERDLERIPDFFFSSFSEEGEWVIIWPVVNRGRDARVSGEGRRAHEDNLWFGEWIVLSVELLWGTGARFALEVHLICGSNCTVFWMGNRQRGGVRVEFPGYPEVLRPETSCLQVFLSPCGTWWPYVVICLISLARGSLVLVASVAPALPNTTSQDVAWKKRSWSEKETYRQRGLLSTPRHFARSSKFLGKKCFLVLR